MGKLGGYCVVMFWVDVEVFVGNVGYVGGK